MCQFFNGLEPLWEADRQFLFLSSPIVLTGAMCRCWLTVTDAIDTVLFVRISEPLFEETLVCRSVGGLLSDDPKVIGNGKRMVLYAGDLTLTFKPLQWYWTISR